MDQKQNVAKGSRRHLQAKQQPIESATVHVSRKIIYNVDSSMRLKFEEKK